MSSINSGDKFLVNRSNKTYQLEAVDTMAEIQDNDLLLINRSGKSYTINGADVRSSISPDQPTYNATAKGSISLGDPVVQNDDGTVSAVSAADFTQTAEAGQNMPDVNAENPQPVVYDPTNNRLFSLKIIGRSIQSRIGTFSGESKTISWGPWSQVFYSQRDPHATSVPPGLFWDDKNQQLIAGWYTRGGGSEQYQISFITVPVTADGTFDSNPYEYMTSTSGSTIESGNPITFLKPTVPDTIHAGYSWVSSSNVQYQIITFNVAPNRLNFKNQANVQNSAQYCSCAISSKDNTILVTSGKDASTVEAKFWRTRADGTGIDLISGTTGNISPSYATWGTRHHKCVYDETQDAFWFVCQILQDLAVTSHDLWAVLVPAGADVPAKKGSKQMAIDQSAYLYTLDYWAPGRKLVLNLCGDGSMADATKLRWYYLEWKDDNIVKSEPWRGINGSTDTKADRINSWVYIPHQGQMLSYYSKWQDYSEKYSAWWNPDYQSTTLTADNYVGMSDASVLDGEEAKVVVFPGVQDDQAGLATNTKYYVQVDGTLEDSPDSISVVAGVAQSPTSIKVQYK